MMLRQTLYDVMGIMANRVSCRAGARLRDRIAEKIGRLPLSYLDSHAAGDIMSRLALKYLHRILCCFP